MAGNRPSVLVVASEPDERALIVAVLRGAGFATATAAATTAGRRGAPAALRCARFAAAVIALRHDRGVALLRAVQRAQPGLPALLVLAPDAVPLAGEGGTAKCPGNYDAIVARPLEPRHLLDRVFELVLGDHGDGRRDEPGPGEDAEYGIAAAKLACLHQRHASAAAAGVSPLMHDLARQIGETRAVYQGFATAMAAA
jgi:CheY-like chemotaxis protein